MGWIGMRTLAERSGRSVSRRDAEFPAHSRRSHQSEWRQRQHEHRSVDGHDAHRPRYVGFLWRLPAHDRSRRAGSGLLVLMPQTPNRKSAMWARPLRVLAAAAAGLGGLSGAALGQSYSYIRCDTTTPSGEHPDSQIFRLTANSIDTFREGRFEHYCGHQTSLCDVNVDSHVVRVVVRYPALTYLPAETSETIISRTTGAYTRRGGSGIERTGQCVPVAPPAEVRPRF